MAARLAEREPPADPSAGAGTQGGPAASARGGRTLDYATLAAARGFGGRVAEVAVAGERKADVGNRRPEISNWWWHRRAAPCTGERYGVSRALGGGDFNSNVNGTDMRVLTGRPALRPGSNLQWDTQATAIRPKASCVASMT